MMSIFFL